MARINPVMGSMRLGRGAPWETLTLRDGERTLTLVRRQDRRRRPHLRHVTQRSADGHFYSWRLGRINVRLAWPMYAPWFIASRIRRAVVIAEDGTILGAWEVEPGLPLGTTEIVR